MLCIRAMFFFQIKGTVAQPTVNTMKMRDPDANSGAELWNENSDVRKSDPSTEVLLKLEGGLNTTENVALGSQPTIPLVRRLENSPANNCGGFLRFYFYPA